jgi:thiamine-phosphate pyrophosphorylase
VKLLAISPGPPDSAWLPILMQLLPLGSQLAFLFRDTSCSTRSYFERAQQLSKLCRLANVPFFVHRRLDIALALNTHLHLPAYGLSPSQARLALPQRKLLSVSVHNEEEASLAKGASFALLSPVFSPGSKPADTRPPLGPQGFCSLAQSLPCPAWALGGISPSTLKLLPKLEGVAVVSALWQAENPLQTAKTLLAHRTAGTQRDNALGSRRG